MHVLISSHLPYLPANDDQMTNNWNCQIMSSSHLFATATDCSTLMMEMREAKDLNKQVNWFVTTDRVIT